MTPHQRAALALLARAIIPADARDPGFTAIDALAKRSLARAELYADGLSRALAAAGQPLETLSPAQLHQLLGTLRDRAPAFFKQLRMDVAAIYLSDPEVWKRIGFPGPSAEKGGYPDFDQPQQRAGNFGTANPIQPGSRRSEKV